jgi:hypothetical protein
MATGGTTQLQPPDLRFLERRGAISHRGPGTFSRSAVLHREMQLFRALLVHYDPRRTSAMSEVMVQLVAELLPEPWRITPTAVGSLALRLQEAPDFAATVREAGVDPAELVSTVASLGYGEKAALLDLALQHQAPAAAQALEEES